MADRNHKVVPFERREAHRWTRLADYWPDPDGRAAERLEPGSLASYPVTPRPDHPARASRRGLLWPVLAVMLAVMLAIWGSGLFQPRKADAPTQLSKSRGLVFGLCSEGGLTNCVASGDSFYLGGKTVRIAGIEAPQLYGAACPREAALGRQSAAKLQSLLNSGEIEMGRVAEDLDRFGLLIRSVSVDGTDVGRKMVDEGLARDIGDMSRSWC